VHVLTNFGCQSGWNKPSCARWWRPCCIDTLDSLRPSHIFIENAKKESNLEGIGTCQQLCFRIGFEASPPRWVRIDFSGTLKDNYLNRTMGTKSGLTLFLGIFHTQSSRRELRCLWVGSGIPVPITGLTSTRLCPIPRLDGQGGLWSAATV